MDTRTYDTVIFVHGCQYTRHHPVRHGVAYRCSTYRRTKCPGRVIKREDDTFMITREHSCVNPATDMERTTEHVNPVTDVDTNTERLQQLSVSPPVVARTPLRERDVQRTQRRDAPPVHSLSQPASFSFRFSSAVTDRVPLSHPQHSAPADDVDVDMDVVSIPSSDESYQYDFGGYSEDEESQPAVSQAEVESGSQSDQERLTSAARQAKVELPQHLQAADDTDSTVSSQTVAAAGQLLRAAIEQYVDSTSVAKLTYTLQQIWKVYAKFYKGVPYRSRGLTQPQVRSRVFRARMQHFGGLDPLSYVELPPLALVKETGQPFFQFNFSYYEKQAKEFKLQRLVGWANPALISLLKAKDTALSIDGTFKVVPRPFYQCIVIMVYDQVSKMYVPVFHILATGKTEWVYWHAIHLAMSTSECMVRPATVTCDFEGAMHNAVGDLFPAARLIGCYFHWKQAIRRHMLKIGLLEPKVEISMGYGRLDLLTVCTESKIKSKGIPLVIKRIKAACKSKKIAYTTAVWNRFWVYFEKTWLRDFEPETWNVHGIEVPIINRTDNPLERYNRTLNGLFPSPHPSLPMFVTTIEQKAQEFVDHLSAISQGLAVAPDHEPVHIPVTAWILDGVNSGEDGFSLKLG